MTQKDARAGETRANDAGYVNGSNYTPHSGHVIDAATIYAGRGWHVFPCCWPTPSGACGCGRGHQGRDVGKAPLTPHGFKDATTDPAIIRQWWARWPLANVAIACGASGLAVIDIDDLDAMHDLADDGRDLPDTPTVTTGRGLHYYCTSHVTGGALVPGIELKADGGYVMAPPSRHQSGRVYTWETTVGETPPSPLPGWVRALIDARTRAHVPIHERGWAATWLRTPLAPGARRGPDGLPKIVGYLRGHGIDVETATAIAELWDAQNPDPLGVEDVRRHVRDMYRRYGMPATDTTITGLRRRVVSHA